MSKMLVMDDGKARWGAPEGYPAKKNTAIEWDGNTEGLESLSGALFRVSDLTPTVNELIGGYCVIGDSSMTIGITAENCVEYQGVIAMVAYDSSPIVIVCSADIHEDELSLKAGTYFLNSSSVFISKLVCQVTETMDPAFLPTEVWTFELDNGETVTLKVAVGK